MILDAIQYFSEAMQEHFGADAFEYQVSFLKKEDQLFKSFHCTKLLVSKGTVVLRLDCSQSPIFQRSIVEFERPPSCFLCASDTWGEYKMPVGSGGRWARKHLY